MTAFFSFIHPFSSISTPSDTICYLYSICKFPLLLMVYAKYTWQVSYNYYIMLYAAYKNVI